MPVMGFTKFERFFRAAGGVSVDRDDVKRYLDFVNDAIYDLLIIGQATAKANVRDVIEPWDLPITKGLQESTHAFQRLEEEIELGPILESLTARPPLDATLDEETEARLPLLFGGISVALARTFKLIDAEREAPLDTATGLRLTRMDVDTGRIEDAVECFGATVVPRLADTGGFCGALLLVDQDTGHSISETMWDSHKALAASRGEAAAVRVETVQSTGALIRAVEEYDLVFSTARISGV
jgi:hypothetical protein